MTTQTASSTIESPRVAELVTRLFAESDASDAKARELTASIPREEITRQMTDPNADYRAFYGLAKDLYLAVSRDTAKLLTMLVRTTFARTVVEYGTSFGISTIHLAAGVRDNGGGIVIGSELEPAKAAKARENLEAAGLSDLTDIRVGDALETLSQNLPAEIDLVLLDGHKALYAKVLDLLAPRLRRGACLVADNADRCPVYLARVRAPNSGFLSVPFADDVELTIKL